VTQFPKKVVPAFKPTSFSQSCSKYVQNWPFLGQLQQLWLFGSGTLSQVAIALSWNVKTRTYVRSGQAGKRAVTELVRLVYVDDKLIVQDGFSLC